MGVFSKVSHKFNPQIYKLYTHRYWLLSKLLVAKIIPKMKFQTIYSIVILVLATIGCKKDDTPASGILKSELVAAVLVSTSSVEVEGRASGPKGAEYGVVYGTTSQPTLAGSFKLVSTFQQPNNSIFFTTFSTTIGQLIPGSRYYFRSYLKNGSEVFYSTETSVELKIDPFWESVGKAPAATDYLPLPEVLLNNLSGTLTLYFKSPDAIELEATSIRFSPFGFSGNWSAPSVDEPIRYNYLRTYIEYGPGDQELFQGLGYKPNPSAQSAFLHYKDFRGEPGAFKRGQLPDYPGDDVPTGFFKVDQQIFVFEKGGGYRLWRYDNDSPITGFVLQTVLPISNGSELQAFVINNKAYFIVEGSPVRLLEYDLTTKRWTPKANFSGEERQRGVVFKYNNRVFYGSGQSTKGAKGLKDIWEYNPVQNAWTAYTTYPGGGNSGMVSGIVRGRTYLGLGYRVVSSPVGAPQYTPRYDFWEFKP